MRSARLVIALAGASGRDAALHARPLLPQPRVWRSLSSAAGKPPSNPFEIDLNVLKTPVSTTERLTLDDAKRAAAEQQAEAQHDINLLHNEVSSLFGEDVAEYGGDTSSSSVEEAVAAFDKGMEIREREVVRSNVTKIRAETTAKQQEQIPVTIAARADVKPKKTKEKVSSGGQLSDDAPVDVVLLQGPCSFVRGIWTGGDIEKGELHRKIQALADDLKIVVKGRDYYSEKIILQTLLEAREDQVIVLCWNICLSKSPFVVHALELIRSRVIIVSPSNVEHGPLPANVVGVLSGFWNQSLSLALRAAANLLEPTKVQKAKLHRVSEAKNPQSSIERSSMKKAKKKKVLTCYLCGKEGHTRRQCPELPRNKE